MKCVFYSILQHSTAFYSILQYSTSAIMASYWQKWMQKFVPNITHDFEPSHYSICWKGRGSAVYGLVSRYQSAISWAGRSVNGWRGPEQLRPVASAFIGQHAARKNCCQCLFLWWHCTLRVCIQVSHMITSWMPRCWLLIFLLHVCCCFGQGAQVFD